MLKKTLLMGAALLYLGSTCLAAVSDAGAGDYYKKEREIYQEKTVPDKDTVTDKTQVPKEEHPSGETTIEVSKFTVNRSEILSAAELKEVTAKYEGKKLTIKELYAVVAEINQLYKAKGYITAKAILPPQKIEHGIVKLQLVEGRIGDILLEGNRHTNGNYIKDRISMQPGDLLKLDKLQQGIFYFNNTNDVAMRAELRPGKEVGTTDCVLRVVEPDEWQVTLFSDNAGSEESGKYRFGMIFANNSLFGNREALVLNPTWTKGTLAGSGSFTFPVDKEGTRLGISYSKNQTNVISGPYETLDIKGNSSDMGLSISRPLAVDVKRKVDGYGELHWKESDTDMAGTSSLLSSRTKTATVGINVRNLEEKSVWSSQYSFTKIYSTLKDAYNGRRFSKFNVSTIRQEEVYKDISLIWRLSGQLTHDKELPTGEKFSLGGMSSVKGFDESFTTGDQGYYVGVEYDFPIRNNKVKGLLFIDHGHTYNVYNLGTRSQEYLTSAGFGLILNYSPNVFGKIVLGIPVASSKEHDATRLHFYLQTNIK